MECCICGAGEVVFRRQYSGATLCRRCFTESVERQVRRTISKHKMFGPDDRIAVAVSGGKDSLTLLHILHRIEREFPRAKMFAITVDEGVEGYRSEAVELVRRNCERLGVEYKLVSFRDVFGTTTDELVALAAGVKGALTPCSYCGVLRRKALNLAAREYGATKLATGHNLDDEIQTMLLNIVHGDVAKLGKVTPVTRTAHGKLVPRVKPLCETPEDEIALYAYLKNIEFQASRCPHSGLALRNEVREFLNKLELRHPGTKYTIYRSFEKLKGAMGNGGVELRDCLLCGEPTPNRLCESCSMLLKLGVVKTQQASVAVALEGLGR